jgi:putative endonuclease
MGFFVYILYSEKFDKYYIGHTEFLSERCEEHNIGKGGSFSSSCMPWNFRYSEEYSTRSEAMKREREIKKKKSR